MIREGDYLCGYEICVPEGYPWPHRKRFFLDMGRVFKDNFENITETVFVNVVLSINNEPQGTRYALKNIDVNRMELSFVPTMILAWQDPFLKFRESSLNKTTIGLDYVKKMDPYILSLINKPKSPTIIQASQTGTSSAAHPLFKTHQDISKRGKLLFRIA